MSHIMCHVSGVSYQVSSVRCHMSGVTCQVKLFMFFFYKEVELVGGGFVINGAYHV